MLNTKFEQVRLDQLLRFTSTFYRPYKNPRVIPISRRRALAYTKNPFAKRSDIALIVAQQSGECVGYLGLVPGYFKFGKRTSRVYWISAFYVIQELRGQGIGTRLVEEALSLGYDITAGKVAGGTAQILKKLKFNQIGYLKSGILNMIEIYRKDSPSAINGCPVTENQQYIEFRENAFRGILSRAKQFFDVQSLVFRRVRQLKAADVLLRYRKRQEAHFVRNPHVLNWMLVYKWVLEEHEAAPRDYRYYFADIRKFTHFFAVKIYQGKGRKKKYIGYCVLSHYVKSGESFLKVLDSLVNHPKEHACLLHLALHYASILKADCLELPEKTSALLKRVCNTNEKIFDTHFLCYAHVHDKKSLLTQASDHIELSHCDSDAAFT